MAKFCELGVESDVVIGKGIDMEDLFGRQILIEKVTLRHSMKKQTRTVTFIRRIPTAHPLGKGGLVLPGRTYLLGLFRKPKPICRQ